VAEPDLTLLVAFVVAIMLAMFAGGRISQYRERRRELARLTETWGQPLRKRREHRNVAARTPARAPIACDRLDDPTWSDLDMARVFERIDRTLSSIGAQTLHRMLRCPLVDPARIERRRALVTAVAADPAARVRVQTVLARLGDAHGWEAWLAVAGALPILPGPVWLLRILPFAMGGMLATGVVLRNPVLVIAGLASALAMPLVHTLANRHVGHHLSSIADVGRVLDAAVGLRRMLPPDVRALVDDVIDRAPALRRAFGRGTDAPRASRFGDLPELAAEYSKAFMLTELVRYQKATRAIALQQSDYDAILDVVGEIDAALSIAYLRAHDEDLRDAEIDPEAPGIVATGLRHPLVPDAVGNDLSLQRTGLLVTGSNMAGKSTLLRAVGVDVVLAQSIGLVAADTWRSRPLRVLTAMGARDDLAAGVSLYRAEVDRIHALVEQARGEHLFVLDEAFRGTNPLERIAASAAVLRRLAATDLVVAATHDRELCDLLGAEFQFGFFTEELQGDDVVFDYRLRPGVLERTNAIALLERAGFPAEVVADARRIAADAALTSRSGR
jgi:hypothetical protein